MTITKEQIIQIFSSRTHQVEVVEDLYRLVFPDYDEIKKIKGWPSMGKDLSKLIWKMFIDFDKKHHPDIVAGGRWMNNGFSTNEKLDPWEIDKSTCIIERSKNESQRQAASII